MAKSYSAAELTRMQELGSAWIFRRVLNDNQTYNTPEDIIKDRKYSELVKIYPAINAEWLKAFHAQQKTMFKEFAPSKFTEFTRDGGFMDYITEMVRQNLKLLKKILGILLIFGVFRMNKKLLQMLKRQLKMVKHPVF
jgi:hypothetical protein